MADDFLGPILVPEPPLISPFPLHTDFGGGADLAPAVSIHSFDQPGLKTEQRFVLGNGVRRFRFQKDHLSCSEYDNLKAHWIQAQGTYAQFPYTHYNPTGPITVTVRYENPVLDFNHLVGLLTGDPGITLLEVPTTFPTYTSLRTLTRFPDSAFDTALSAQEQHIIPLIAIQDRAGATTPMYLSDRRLTLDGKLYLPRLASWGGIAQSLGEASDSAQFIFGNADGVFTQLVNQISLYRALVQFALYHVESRVLVKLWAGYALPWSFDTEGHFQLGASDGVFELGLAYPTRMITRTCWKVYKGRFCPSVSALTTCPKDFDSCVVRGVPKSFGGVVVPAQAIQVQDNSTGTWGWGRSQLTSVTVSADTVYQRPVQEVYTNKDMLVACDVAAGRDESEFYSALGLVSDGPLGGYSTDLIKHKLDDQPPHDPLRNGGWRGIVGNDPAGDSDYFGLDQAPWVQHIRGWIPTMVDLPATGNQDGDGWITADTVHLYVYYGGYFTDNGRLTYAGGLAFAEIRRTDEAGLQLSKLTDRKMSVTVSGGVGGWTWTAPGARVWTPKLANCIWVAVNVFLRAIGLRVDSSNGNRVTAAQMEAFFDVTQAIAMAQICGRMVNKLVGAGMEEQFPFCGILKERKPLKDWLQEILNCCLGYYAFVNGKLWFGIRENSGATNAFTRANVIFKSLQTTPIEPQFNYLIGEFGDEEFDFSLNNVTVYDIDQASFAGTVESPQFNSSTISLVGVSNKSQAARIISTRLREEVGGVGPTEQMNARSLRFRTTILGLKTMVGDIISLDHSVLPGNHLAEGRVQKWTLNPDYSIDIEATPTTDAMYDLTFGPKPVDVTATPVPPETLPSITGLTWMPNEVSPVLGDPLFTDILERTFDLWQDYKVARDGTWEATIYVAGEMCINTFAPGRQPRILAAVLAAGGTLAGPQTVYLGITQRMEPSYQPLTPSNLAGLWIPAGVTGRKVKLTVSASPDSDQPWDLWVGNDRRTIALQSSSMNVQPTVDFTGPIHRMTEGMPEASARKVAIAAKRIWHSGVAGVSVTGVTAPNKIQSNDFIGSTDNWLGPPARILSALADFSDGSAPLWNFTVTDFDSVSGTFTVTPNCVRTHPDSSPDPENSVQEGDVLIVRSTGISHSANTIGDPLWHNFVATNQFGVAGLRPDEEKGRIARIMFGTGRGQWRYITGNTSTVITVSPNWDTQPDATSVVIVEDPDWSYQTETSDLDVLTEGARVEIKMRVTNLRNLTALVAGFIVDDRDNYSSEEVAPMREIFVYGGPPGVRVVGPQTIDPATSLAWTIVAADQTIRVDTSTNDVTVQLLPVATYEGRTLYVVNDTGPGTATVLCADGEFLFDGNDFVTLAPMETVRVTSG